MIQKYDFWSSLFCMHVSVSYFVTLRLQPCLNNFHKSFLFQSSQSLLYCQFCHMYRTYIQRIEIALLSDPLVHTDNTKH